MWTARKEFIHALNGIFMHEVETGTTDAETFSEGRSTQRKITIFERSRSARKACLKEFGTRCFICQFDFGKKYGSRFAGNIQVHHLDPISWRRSVYELDPKRDLRPVCPNCHYALKAGSCIRLDEALDDLGYSLMPADREVIYENLLKAVRHAASLRYEGTFEPKKLTRSQILDLVRERVQSATSGSRGTILLREKLTAAGMASQFEYATGCRRKYLSELHETDYRRRKPLETLSEQVRHKLHDLSTALQVQALAAGRADFL